MQENNKEKNKIKWLLLAKTKLNKIEVSISKTSTDSNISHKEFEFVLVNNVLKGYNDMKKAIKNHKSV